MLRRKTNSWPTTLCRCGLHIPPHPSASVSLTLFRLPKGGLLAPFPVCLPAPLLGMSSLPLPSYACSSFRSQDKMKPSRSFSDCPPRKPDQVPQHSFSETLDPPSLHSAQINFGLVWADLLPFPPDSALREGPGRFLLLNSQYPVRCFMYVRHSGNTCRLNERTGTYLLCTRDRAFLSSRWFVFLTVWLWF